MNHGDRSSSRALDNEILHEELRSLSGMNL